MRSLEQSTIDLVEPAVLRVGLRGNDLHRQHDMVVASWPCRSAVRGIRCGSCLGCGAAHVSHSSDALGHASWRFHSALGSPRARPHYGGRHHRVILSQRTDDAVRHPALAATVVTVLTMIRGGIMGGVSGSSPVFLDYSQEPQLHSFE